MNQYLSNLLGHAAYQAAIRLPKYNGKVTVFQATCDLDGARVLRQAHPQWSQDDHVQLSAQHAELARREQARYSELLNDAAMETFGRPFATPDYRISAIGSEEFSATKKEELRAAAHAATRHNVCARAHAKAAHPRRAVRF